ncbi:DUF803 domain containing protein [Hyaloscypha variabilis]
MYLSTPAIDAVTTSAFAAPALASGAALSTLGSSLFRDGDSQLQRWSSLIGIVTAIVGNILISFALNIQRYAHIRLSQERSIRKEKSKLNAKSPQNGYGTTGANGHRVVEVDEEPDDSLRTSFHSTNTQSSGCSDDDHKQDSNYLRSPYWWGGIALMTIGETGNFLAYGFAPASIVSPLGVVALISNCVIAPIMLKERFRLRDFWGVVVAVAGAVVVVLSAKQQEKKLGPHEIWGAITTTEFEVYMAITVCLIGVLVWASPRYGNRTILIDLGLVGLFGGYTALSTKGVASMLSSTLWRALTTPVTYALVAVLVGTAVMQVKYVNKALARFDSTQVIPVQFVMFTLSVIIGSAVLYRDFEKATADSVGKFIGGCLLTFFGVFLITSGRPRRDEDDEEEESDEEGEERINLIDQEPSGQEFEAQEGPRKRTSANVYQNGDGADDEAFSDSRRSSRVSFVDPSQPRAPHRFSVSSYQPSIRVVPSAPPSESPAEETPLLNNPWKSDELLQAARHPGLANTSSSPVLPSEAQLSTESLKPPSTLGRTFSQGSVHTHPNHQQGPAPPQADARPVTPARHSISRMMPGPFISPLSGGLSVVVADTMRRGLDTPSKLKRTRLGLRRSKSGSHRLAHSRDGNENEPETPSKNGDEGQEISKSLDTEPTKNWSRMTRARSLSNTLGDYFRGKRQKTEQGHADADEEAGPSGS